MFIWWSKHLQLIVDSKLHKNIIDQVANSGIIVLSDGMKDLFKTLDNNLLKIGFLNDNEDKLLDKYLEKYDIVVTGDGGMLNVI